MKLTIQRLYHYNILRRTEKLSFFQKKEGKIQQKEPNNKESKESKNLKEISFYFGR